MPKAYYLFNPGRLSRKDNSLQFVATDEEGNQAPPKYIPIEDVSELFAFGSLDANSATFNFLAKNNIVVHFFDYYEHYTGSFMPKDYLLSGKMQIEQTKTYLDPGKRLDIARLFVLGSATNILRNLRYYLNRQKDVAEEIDCIEKLLALVHTISSIEALMGIEGNIRQYYYNAFEIIINDFSMGNRSKRPPSNEVNALISFGNMLCYTACLDSIYHTQLNPTISFLHQPGERRYSLALDLAEIFKPVLVDRMIFSLFNKKQLQANDFDHHLNSVVLKQPSKKTVVKVWDERLKETIKHENLSRNVSYKHLIKLECYKICKHILQIEPYKPFKMK